MPCNSGQNLAERIIQNSAATGELCHVCDHLSMERTYRLGRVIEDLASAAARGCHRCSLIREGALKFVTEPADIRDIDFEHLTDEGVMDVMVYCKDEKSIWLEFYADVGTLSSLWRMEILCPGREVFSPSVEIQNWCL